MRGAPYTTPINQQQFPIMIFNSLSHITLQQIYVLSTQPGNSSIQLTFITNFIGASSAPKTHFNIILHDLTVAAFPGFSIGDIIPCQLSSTFVAVTARQLPQCRLVHTDKYHS